MRAVTASGDLSGWFLVAPAGRAGQHHRMDLVRELPAFFVAVVLISASPGPAVALILRRAALRGLRRTVPVVLGLEAGLYLWALLAAAGVAALVAASEAAFVVLRVVGAVVLIGLGVRAWRTVWRQRPGAEPLDAGPAGPCGPGPAVPRDAAPLDAGPSESGGPPPREQSGPLGDGAGRGGARRAFAEGAAVQLANPKAAVFMVAFFPQFIPAGRPVFATTAVLAALQVALETCLYLALAASVASAGGWFRRPAIRRRLEAVSGTVLVGLGLRVAATSH
jgi:threonine/homoserine/homoserine lactone efflux protein